MHNKTYKGYNAGRGPSPRLWQDFPIAAIQEDPGKGVFFFDDFLDFPLPGTQTTEIALGRYKVYNTGSGKVQVAQGFPTTHVPHGLISMLCDTDGDQSAIGIQQTPILLNSSAGKMVFEARFGMTGIATNNAQVFVGLAENAAFTYGAAQPLANADATSNAGGLIGFNILEDGVGVLNTSYADRATSWTNVQASVGTMAAHTWKKLGFIYDPNDSTNAITFYVDGVRQTSVISASTLTGLTYLDVGGLSPCFAMFADSAGTSTYGYLDWWGFAQLSA